MESSLHQPWVCGQENSAWLVCFRQYRTRGAVTNKDWLAAALMPLRLLQSGYRLVDDIFLSAPCWPIEHERQEAWKKFTRLGTLLESVESCLPFLGTHHAGVAVEVVTKPFQVSLAIQFGMELSRPDRLVWYTERLQLALLTDCQIMISTRMTCCAILVSHLGVQPAWKDFEERVFCPLVRYADFIRAHFSVLRIISNLAARRCHNALVPETRREHRKARLNNLAKKIQGRREVGKVTFGNVEIPSTADHDCVIAREFSSGWRTSAQIVTHDIIRRQPGVFYETTVLVRRHRIIGEPCLQ